MKRHTRWPKPATLAVALLMQLGVWGQAEAVNAVQEQVSPAPALDLSARKKFDIPSQPLAAALLSFSEQASIQVMTASADLSGLTSAAVSGEMSVQEALSNLLRNTRLRFHVVSESAVSIEPISKIARKDQDVSFQEVRSLPVAGKYQGKGGEGDKKLYPERTAAATSAEVTEMGAIVVTGTNIRGRAPAGSPLLEFGQANLEQAGVSTIDQFLRKLPQNFGVVDSGTYLSGIGTASAAGANFGRSSAANLRGLGPGSTLSLLDGHRLAPSGGNGAYADVSIIPYTALERVQILGDGASAIYGSDAIAGVVNFMLRHDLDGAESSIRYGFSADGGAREIRASQALGHVGERGNIMVAYEFLDQNRLEANERYFIPAQPQRIDVLPAQTRHSVILSGERDMFDGTTVSANALYSHRRYEQISYQVSDGAAVDARGGNEARQVTAEIRQRIGDTWHAKFSGSYALVEEQRIEAISGVTYDLPQRSKYQGLDLSASGPLIRLPGGDLEASLGGAYRRENFTPFDSRANGQSFGRNVASVFAEAHVPIVGPESQIAFVRELTLSLAARHDQYSVIGTTTNPKVGLNWRVDDALSLRGSYSTAFKAPLLFNLAPSITSFFTLPFPDPNAVSGSRNVLLNSSSYNPNLKPENARSFTLGFDYAPKREGLPKLSLTYYDISFRDRIDTPPVQGSIFNIFGQIETLSPFVIFNPSLAQVQQIFDENTVFDFIGGGPAAVEAIVDFRPANLASVESRGIDLQLDYDTNVGGASLSLNANLNYMMALKAKAIVGQPFVSLLNQTGGPPAFRAWGGAKYQSGFWSAGLMLNYVQGYRNINVTPTEHIDAWTTADLQISWGRGPTSITLDVENIANAKPPRVSKSLGGDFDLGYDAANASPRGRFITLSVRQTW